MRQSASKHSFFLYLGIIIVVCTGLFYWADLDNIFGSNTNRAAELPTRSDLLRKLYKNRKAILVYGTGDAQLTAPYKSFAEHVKSRRRWLDIKFQSDG
ncbi:MAG: hypothetical protein GWN16_11160, partial [Calditrichae bacterium]|nr:hypothetical protein [Calditrichia bacterium]NIW79973.1 hypothetical protein [Calditrichia bacterium]